MSRAHYQPVYSVPQYLTRLRLAKRSPNTLLEYHNAFKSFAAFLNVPIEELHNPI